jgi:hypothetical protein
MRFPGQLSVVVLGATLGIALTLVTGCATTVDGSGQGHAARQPASASAPSSGVPTRSAPAAQPDACSLLTRNEAEALADTKLMAPVGAGPAGSGGNTLCEFTGPTTGPVAQVEVYIGDGAKKQLDIERDNLKHAFTSVAGIGDQCVQEDDFIFVEKNGEWASIHLVLLNDPQQNVKRLQTAIKQLTDRLP